MAFKGYIYKITNMINGKVYIGQAIDVMARFKEHIKKSKTATKGIDAAIRKYGAENFTVVTICSYESKQELNEAEKHFIAVYRQFYGRKGCYNIADGGEGGNLYDKKGEKHPMYSKHHSEETKKKQSEALKGEKSPMYGRTGEKHPMYGKPAVNRRKVNQYDLNGNFIRTWDCIKEAAKELGINKSNIGAVCRGERNKAGGFIWRLIEEEA